MVIRELMSF